VIPFNRLHDLFVHAMACGPSERQEFLDQVREESPTLRALLDQLLSSDTHDITEQSEQASALARPDGQIVAGTKVDRWTVFAHLRRGNMGSVYLADDSKNIFTRPVALKFMRANYYEDELLQRFRQERQILGHLAHPHIVRVIEGGSYEGREYIVMDFVDGAPLDQYCASASLSQLDRISLVARISMAAEALHEKGVSHGDLKFDNILVRNDGHFVIVDFGIASIPVPQFVNSVAFASDPFAGPEQRAGAPPTPVGDVFALGRILEKLLDDGPSPRKWPTSVLDSSLKDILNKSLNVEPSLRYPSGGSLADELDRYLRYDRVRAHDETFIEAAVRRIAKYPLRAGALLVLIVILAIGGFTLLERRQSEANTMARRAIALLDDDPHQAVELARRAAILSTSLDIVDVLRSAAGNPLTHVIRPSDKPLDVALSSKGSLMAILLPDGKVELRRTSTGGLIWRVHTELPGPGHQLSRVRFAAGDRFIELDGDTFLSFLDIENRELLFMAGTGTRDKEEKRVYSPSGAWELLLKPNGDTERLFSWRGSNKPVDLSFVDGPTVMVAFSAKEDRIAIASRSALHLVDLPSGTRLASIPLHNRITALAFCTAADLVTAAFSDGEIAIWRDRLSTPRRIRPQRSAVILMDCTDSATTVATIAADGTLAMTDALTGAMHRHPRFEHRDEPPTWLRLDSAGSVAALGLRDGHVRVWSWRTETTARLYRPHGQAVLGGAVSPGGPWIATQSADGTVRIWNRASGETAIWSELTSNVFDSSKLLSRHLPSDPVRQGTRTNLETSHPVALVLDPASQRRLNVTVRAIGTHTSLLRETDVESATISSDRSLVAFVARDGTLRIWNTTTRRLQAVKDRLPHEYSNIFFIPQTHVLLAASSLTDGLEAFERRHLIDADTGEVLAILPWPKGWSEVVFSPDGRVFAARFDGEVRAWRTFDGSLIFHGSLAVHPARASVDVREGIIAVAQEDGVVRIWALAEPALLQEQPVTSRGTREYAAAAVIDARERYALVNRGGSLTVWELSNRSKVFQADVGREAWFTQASFNPSQDALILPGSGNDLTIWSLSGQQAIQRCCQHTSAVRLAEFRAGGKQIVSQTTDGQTVIWDAESGQRLVEVRGAAAARKSRSGRLVETNHRPSFSVSPDARSIATIVDFTLQIVDHADRVVTSELPKTVHAFQFSPVDGDAAMITQQGPEVHSLELWQAQTARWTTLLSLRDSIYNFVFSTSGRFLASRDVHALRIWDVRTGRQITELRAFKAELLSPIAFIADDQFLLTSAVTNDVVTTHVLIVDLTTGARVRTFPGFTGVSSPSGTKTVIVSDGRIELYDTPEFTSSLEALRSIADVRLRHSEVLGN
jgi:WD40 repeat protein/predicted Ser/Thr protein kinase